MSYLDIATWAPLGDHQYRTVRVYDSMLWGDDVELEDHLVVGAPCGGPIALARDPTKVTAFRLGGVDAADAVSFYSASGKLQGRGTAEASRLVAMAWTAAEHLVAVFENGAVDVWDAKGERSEKSFPLLPTLAEETIVEASICANGLAALARAPDGSFTVYLVGDLDKPLPVPARDIGLPTGVRPTAMTAIDGRFTAHGRIEVVLGTPDSSLVVVKSELEAEDMQLSSVLSSPPMMMSVSPGGKYLALLGEDGVLCVLDTAFERKLVEFETHASSPPLQLVWCGEDSVASTWPDKGGVLLVGPFGDYLRLPYDGAVSIVSELDGLRIITNNSYELLQRVPQPLLAIRSIGSTSPGALLLDATTLFAEEDAKCDETIRNLIREEALADAVSETIAAALVEWDTNHQMALLRAASYGKTFDPDIEAAPFVSACKTLRVLNALRGFDVGMPLTADELDYLTPPVVIDRLLARHHHRLALHLCDYLGLRGDRGRDKVLVHWASAKVRASSALTDEAVRDVIRERLRGVASVSYADIAATADASGRRRLATLLLDFEPRVRDQVPILLKMREGRLALEKSLDSGDTELIYMCLLHLRRSLRIGASTDPGASASASGPASGSGGGGAAADATFIRLVLAYPAAVSLLAAYCKAGDPELLLALYTAAGRHVDAGQVLLREAYLSSDLPTRIRGLKRAAEAFAAAEKAPLLPGNSPLYALASGPPGGRPSADRVEAAFLRSTTEDQVELLITQAQLEKEKGASFLDFSLNDTIFNVILGGDHKRAAALAKDFKVPDAAFWFIKIRALSKARDWPALLAFSNERKSPVGFRPFADACVAEGANIEARKYALRIPDYEERVELLLTLGAYTEAAEAAAKAKDLDRLRHIADTAPTPSGKEVAEKALAALGGGGGGARGR